MLSSGTLIHSEILVHSEIQGIRNRGDAREAFKTKENRPIRDFRPESRGFVTSGCVGEMVGNVNRGRKTDKHKAYPRR